jgi:hypothetical protein
MNSLAYSNAELTQRLHKLEAELAELKKQFSGRTIQAHMYAVVDNTGRTRGWFGLNEDGNPEFKLAGSDGSIRSEVVLDDSDAPRIVLFDDVGRQRAAIQVAETGEASTYLWDDTGANIIALRARANGSCEIVLTSGITTRLSLATEPEGIAQVELSDDSEEARVVIRSGVDRPGELLLLDSRGSARAEFFLETDDAAGIRLHDHLGHRRLSASLDLIGEPAITIFDDAGQELTSLNSENANFTDQAETAETTGAEDSDDDDSYEFLEEDEELVDLDENGEADPDAELRRELARLRQENFQLGMSHVAASLYPTDLVDTWCEAMSHSRADVRSYERALSYDSDLAIAIIGIARGYSWHSTSLGGSTSSHTGVAVLLVVANQSSKDIKLLNVGNLVLIDERGHQYSCGGSFYWAEGTPTFNSHGRHLMGNTRQEGFVLFPSLKSGSKRYVRAILLDSFSVGDEFRERRYEISLE